MRPRRFPRRVLRHLALVASAGLLGALALAPPAHAIEALGPQQTVHQPTACGTRGEWVGDVGAGGDGATRGFATYADPDCVTPIGHGYGIVYFERSGSGWRSERTPYVGDVLAVGVDATGTYLLYNSQVGQPNSGLRITKRLANGTFTGGKELAPGLADSGDVIVSGGAWWAVWSQRGSHGVPADLYQARTIVSAKATQRITSSPAGDVTPALARRRDGRAVLAWTKRTTLPGTGPVSSVWRAEADRAGRWSSAKLPGQRPSSQNENADVDIYRNPATGVETTFIAWAEPKVRAVHTVTNRNWALRNDVNGGGYAPRLRAISSTRYTLALLVDVLSGQRVVRVAWLEKMAFGAGQIGHAVSVGTGNFEVIGLTVRAGKATMVYARLGTSPALLARTEN